MVNFTSQSDSAEAVSDQIQVLFQRACIQHRACDRGATGFRLSQHGKRRLLFWYRCGDALFHVYLTLYLYTARCQGQAPVRVAGNQTILHNDCRPSITDRSSLLNQQLNVWNRCVFQIMSMNLTLRPFIVF